MIFNSDGEMHIDSFSVLSIVFLFFQQRFCSMDSFSVLSIAFLFYDSFSVLSIAFLFFRQLCCSIDSFSVLSIAFLFYRQLFCSINVANIFELPSEDGNITPEKARKLRQTHFRDKNVYRQLFCSIDRFSVLLKAFLFYPQLFCSMNMANILEFPSKDGNINDKERNKNQPTRRRTIQFTQGPHLTLKA